MAAWPVRCFSSNLNIFQNKRDVFWPFINEPFLVSPAVLLQYPHYLRLTESSQYGTFPVVNAALPLPVTALLFPLSLFAFVIRRRRLSLPRTFLIILLLTLSLSLHVINADLALLSLPFLLLLDTLHQFEFVTAAVLLVLADLTPAFHLTYLAGPLLFCFALYFLLFTQRFSPVSSYPIPIDKENRRRQ
ncbi:MAG: hypothetical protein M1609_09050 [Firmicutes bacterium]|nr:hypothetical protein [Bacillota bacterium]